ncbi:MAG TPA: T9SS type A sorting domain-containing protein, partial [Candidatus Kapabacteria bacterium]
KAGFHTGNHNSQTGTGAVVVLGATELDLSKPLLFSIAYVAKSRLNDSANSDYIGHMEVDTARLELSIESGIDEVIVSDGWVKYVKVPPPEPEKRKSITLSSDSVVMASDSSVWLSLRTSQIDSARVKRTVFSFSVDTSVVVFDTAIVGSAFNSAASLTIENKITKVNLFVNSTDDAKALAGNGEFLKLKFTARKREDTVSTHLFDSAFFALNTDNLLDTVRYELEKITVYGIKTPVETVEEEEIEIDSHVSLVPNPADESVLISSEVQGELIEIYSLLGEKVYSSLLNERIYLDTKVFPSGWYQVQVQRGGKQKMTRLLIQH